MTHLIKSFCVAAALLVCGALSAQPAGYQSLDPGDPIEFGGSYIVYGGERITLGDKAIFIDGRLSDAEAAKYPYVYNSVNEAAKHLTPGSFEDPMVLYIAPWVYWIDDPDDPEVRQRPNLYGLVINCPGLRFYGLNKDPYNVVLCCNRGQTMGSNGNYTLFQLIGDGITAENVTFANYCNIDLVYPLNPALNRAKRGSAIVQAQLISSPGDKIFARNCNFLSRLNLMPFLGAKRLLFDHCHLESTDDALSTGIYLDCSFEFHNKKPFGGTGGTGAVFLNADVVSFSPGDQYFTKMGGPMTVVDTRINGENADYVGWRDFPTIETRNYQYNFEFNGKPYLIGQRNACSTIDMKGKRILDAFRYELDGQVYYNVFNLTRGTDDWDPMGLKEQTEAHERILGRNLTRIPTQITVAPTRQTLETGVGSITLKATERYYGGGTYDADKLVWNVADGKDALVTLRPDGYSCEVIPNNNTDNPEQVTIEVRNAYGLEGAAVLTILPSKLPAPGFAAAPKISIADGFAKLEYTLDSHLTDQSLVEWYRYDDRKGSNPQLLAVSRLDKPLKNYKLKTGETGKYMGAVIRTKHQRSDAGEPVEVRCSRKVRAKDVKTSPTHYKTDFVNVPLDNQPNTREGSWTILNAVARMDTLVSTTDGPRAALSFGPGEDGAAGLNGLMQSGGHSLMYYTPYGHPGSDVRMHIIANPFKFEGQGFSVAWNWMDILVDYNPQTKTGYGVRFIRTTKYHDAIDCLFVRYENGIISEISDPVSTTAYRPTCDITVTLKGDKLSLKMTSDAQYIIQPNRPEVKTAVDMQTSVRPSGSGTVGIMYAGGAYTMLNELELWWE